MSEPVFEFTAEQPDELVGYIVDGRRTVFDISPHALTFRPGRFTFHLLPRGEAIRGIAENGRALSLQRFGVAAETVIKMAATQVKGVREMALHATPHGTSIECIANRVTRCGRVARGVGEVLRSKFNYQTVRLEPIRLDQAEPAIDS